MRLLRRCLLVFLHAVRCAEARVALLSAVHAGHPILSGIGRAIRLLLLLLLRSRRLGRRRRSSLVSCLLLMLLLLKLLQVSSRMRIVEACVGRGRRLDRSVSGRSLERHAGRFPDAWGRGLGSSGSLGSVVLLEVGRSLRVGVEVGKGRVLGRRVGHGWLLHLRDLVLRFCLGGDRWRLCRLKRLLLGGLSAVGLRRRLIEQVQAAELDVHGGQRGLLRCLDSGGGRLSGRLVKAWGSVQLSLLWSRGLSLLLFFVPLDLGFKLGRNRLALCLWSGSSRLRFSLVNRRLLLLNSVVVDHKRAGRVLFSAGGHGCGDVRFSSSVVVSLLVRLDLVVLLTGEH